MIKLTAALAALVALGGCVSSPTAADYAQGDANTCSSYGFQEGSEAYAQCRMQLGMQRRAAASAMLGAYLGRPLPAPAQAYQLPMPPAAPVNRSLNCNTSVTSSTTATTNCQ